MSSGTLPGTPSSSELGPPGVGACRLMRRSVSPRGVPRCYGAERCTYLCNTRHLGQLRRGSTLAFPPRPDLHHLHPDLSERTFHAHCNLDALPPGRPGHVAHSVHLGG